MRFVVGAAIVAQVSTASAAPEESETQSQVPWDPMGWWARPIERISATVMAFDEDDRPYSTPERPRDVDGIVALSCEHQEGRPCGNGQGVTTELDASAGYGSAADVGMRLRGTTGTGGYSDDLVLDRVFARFRAGPAFAEVGRDVVAIGPAARTQLAWGDNAPPIDQVRLETLHPYPLAEDVHGSLLYLIGQRRDPSQQHPPLITIARAQLDVGRVAVGLHQELALGGDGVPSYSVWDFALEHVRRRDSSAGPTDSSNRRFGGDVAVQLPGARVYYELVFEDLRKHVFDALHYDADHLIGADLSWLVVELQRVGVRSYEHVPAISQFTNAGRIVGSPLGPDTQSVYVASRVRGAWGTLTPWVELVRFSSDTYTFIDHGPILHDSDGTAEYRYRIGAKGLTALTRELDVEARLTYERVTNLAFQSGTSRNNAGLMVTMTWRPGWLLR